jgi:hypothetical protein
MYIVSLFGHRTWQFEGFRDKIIATVGSVGIEIVNIYLQGIISSGN